MHRRKTFGIVAIVAILSTVLTSVALADFSIPTLADGAGDNQPAQVSHRLIVELDSPALADAYQSDIQAAGVNGELDVSSSAAQAYLAQLQAEQAAFVVDMQSALEGAAVSTFVNELGVAEET